MQTLKQLKQDLVEDNLINLDYSSLIEEDYNQLMRYKEDKNYLAFFEFLEDKFDEYQDTREFVMFDTGYATGYKDAVYIIGQYFSAINLTESSIDKKTFSASELEELFNNLLQ